MVEFEDWPEYHLKALITQVDEARNKGQYTFIQDLHGESKIYFQYKH